MSMFDAAKDAAKKAAAQGQELAGQAAARSKDFAADHKDQLGSAIGRGGSVLDKQTKGRFSDQISKAATRAGALVDKIPEK
jgi:hypothetical protein